MHPDLAIEYGHTGSLLQRMIAHVKNIREPRFLVIGYFPDDMQGIDAPEIIPAGSCKCAHGFIRQSAIHREN